jgi:hypothetical protein
MPIVAKVKEHLGENEELITKIIPIVEGMDTEYKTLTTNMDILSNQVVSKDEEITTVTAELKSIKDLLGISADMPVNKELIESKLSSGDANLDSIESKYNDMILTINNKHNNEISKLTHEISKYKEDIYDLKIDTKISTLGDVNANEGALDDINRYLKANAHINPNGTIGYKKDGVIVRNDKGFEMTLDDKLKELKHDRKYLFKSEVQQGGNLPASNSNNSSSSGLSAFGLRMAQRSKRG